jgi:hypothetical protein
MTATSPPVGIALGDNGTVRLLIGSQKIDLSPKAAENLAAALRAFSAQALSVGS